MPGDLEITPRSVIEININRITQRTLSASTFMGSNTISSVTMAIKDSNGDTVTSNFSGGVSNTTTVITFGLTGYAAGTYTITFTVTANETTPDGTALKYYPEFTLVVTDSSDSVTAATGEVLVSYALSTLNHAKIALGISLGTFTDDAFLVHRINDFTAYAEKYCTRRFASTTYTNERYDGTGRDKIFLRNWPIISVSSLTIDNEAINEATDYDDYDGYWIEPTLSGIKLEGCLYRVDKWDRGWQNVKITYVAGYATIPHDLREACFLAVKTMYDVMKNKEGKKSETLGRYSYTFESLPKSIRDQVHNTLDMYRRLY